MPFCRAQRESLPGTLQGRQGRLQRSSPFAAAAEQPWAAFACLSAASCLLLGGPWLWSPSAAPVAPEVLPRQLLDFTRPVHGNCSGSAEGFPLNGILYTPHMVGEPYPLPDSSPTGYYGEFYAGFHKRDLPLIGQVLGADTVLLRPWAFHETGKMDIFARMSSAGICKVVPTFHLSKFYADLLKSGDAHPATDSNSPLFNGFVQFGRAVSSGSLGEVQVAAWSVDVSLDLELLLLGDFDEACHGEPVRDPSYRRYKRFLEVLVKWVRQYGAAAPVAPALQDVPLLVPLDISRVSFTQHRVQKKLTNFLHCMGRWSPVLFGGASGTRWLLSFALPHRGQEDYNLTHWLGTISSTLQRRGTRAIVMVGAQALRSDPNNVNDLVDDFGSATAAPEQQAVLQRAFADYSKLRLESPNLDGFILDEWQDDWDRGARGPFYLAADTLTEMRGVCARGGRYSHDIASCARKVGNGWVYPEFFGLAGTDSQALAHCIAPRFREGLHFRYPGGNSSSAAGLDEVATAIPVQCRYFRPAYVPVACAAGLLLLVGTLQGCAMLARFCCVRGRRGAKEPCPPQDKGESVVGYVTVTPHEKRLCGGHVIELSSHRLRSNEEAGWWLWTHLRAQMAILEKQVLAEVSARQALRARQAHMGAAQKVPSTPREPALEDPSNDLAAAVATVHRRVLEGFASWCLYIAGAPLTTPSGVQREVLREFAKMVEENQGRTVSRLFVEALLLRVMESLGEQVLQCPERVSYLLFNVLLDASGTEYSDAPTTFAVDLDSLQSGLEEMQHHSNPYVRKRMPNGKIQRGLNFDDINESGIQCRPEIAKTYKEPNSILVIVDFFLCYRAPFMIKLWTMFIAGYIYLGSGMGNDITTVNNGAWYEPRWLRINFIQYTAMGDAACWVLIELLLIAYVAWQRWPSLGRRSPGVPNLVWFLEHAFNLTFSGIGACWVFVNSSFERKPLACRGADARDCQDDRSGWLLVETLGAAGVYWALRISIFCLMHQKHNPIFIHGTPWSKTRKDAGRTCVGGLKSDLAVNAAWICMLAVCIVIEVCMLFPSLQGLSLSAACGLDILGGVPGLPQHEVGTCSQSDHWLSFGCATCVSSVALAGLLVFLGSFVDIYFVFYVFSSILGSIMGHRRHLNDLKNTSVPVDLRPQVGREARLFEHTFGPEWQQVWVAMARNLFAESHIGPKHYAGLVEAAGLTEDGLELTSGREKKMRPIHLSRFPGMAAERLAFFFQSLEWIEKPSGPGRGMHFEPGTDALTGAHFDPGSVPSLTQIIPAYNEVVIPSADFLRSGDLPEDAMNQSPEGQPGVGDVTDPPRGDGVNTNLAFMISQFPEEWSFLAQRLHHEGQLEAADAHALYKHFIQDADIREELVVEVRLWAALRCQSVAKTVIGALQYQRALATLPKIREYYASRPGKRTPEDHAEVILAHQTYGQKAPDGSWDNDEAVRLLLMRYGADSLLLVFDLTPNSEENIWKLVEAFLHRKGGYEKGAFDYASVKCKWDPVVRDLRILDVMPRKFPLRLGKGDYKTQGKAGNQLNALRFASGHYVQALDCNMGCFIGEGFKVPYVLRVFMPLDKSDRVAARCRYLGFREYIFTGREGTVGKCHATAEWTFGTIYQRFLSGMGARMHYGHPDFVDGFWARNRGGMSKCSAVVNLSEDIFAGYNVRMREEASPHIDALEFEKGRESTFNAASNFFAKISGGSVAVIRSRDNHLLCERIGILHSLSFYFASVAFYVSNYIVDASIRLYVLLFVSFTLANIDLARLHRLGSSFSSEWIVSMGVVSLIPQLFEMVLEYGAIRAIREAVGGLFAATWFFVFQNKNISSAMCEGAATGVAKYLFTGRPMANQHQTWRDAFVTYSKSHYQPAFSLLAGYLVYHALARSSFEGRLPMLLIVLSFTAWLITPIIFSPLPRLGLIRQDLQEFGVFVNGRAGMDRLDLADVVDRGKRGRARTLFEFGLADEISTWGEQPLFVLAVQLLTRAIGAAVLVLALPAEIADFLWIYGVTLSLQWCLVFAFFACDQNNHVLIASFLVWPAALVAGRWVIGHRASSPGIFGRLPEYFISLLVFLYLLGLLKRCVVLTSRLLYCFRRTCWPVGEVELRTRLHESIRLAYVYFFTHQLHCVQAYAVLLCNLTVSLALALIDCLPGRPHTWWLLNAELARTRGGEQYLDRQPTFLEQEAQRSSASSSCGEDSDASSDTAATTQSRRTSVAGRRR